MPIASKLYGKYRRAFAMVGLVIRPTELTAPSSSPRGSAATPVESATPTARNTSP